MNMTATESLKSPYTGTFSNSAYVWTIIKVDFVNKFYNSVDELNIAKWENSFNSGSPVTVKSEFIDPDDDRFYIEVDDASKAGDPIVLARISTDSPASPYANYDDPANDVTLYAVAGSPGKFRSKSMFLVSNDTDDEYPAGTDEQSTDRTHLIALGGEAIVEYPASSPIAEKRADVVSKGSVTVNMVNMRETVGGALSAASPGHIDDVKQWTTEAYAQVGLSVSFTYAEADPPQGVNLGDANGLAVQVKLENTNPYEKYYYLDQEFRSLVDAHGTPGQLDDVHLFLVPRVTIFDLIDGVVDDLLEVTGIAVYSGAATWTAYPPPAASLNQTRQYLNNFAVSVDVFGGFMDLSCTAHELGHILTNSGHSTANNKSYNIMQGGGDVFPPQEVTDRKRLNENQDNLIQSNGYTGKRTCIGLFFLSVQFLCVPEAMSQDVLWQSGSQELSRSDVEWHLQHVSMGTGESVESIRKDDAIKQMMRSAGDRLSEVYHDLLADEQMEWKFKAVLLNDLYYLPGDFSSLRGTIRSCLSSSPLVAARSAAITALAKWGNEEDLDYLGDVLNSGLTDIDEHYHDAVRLRCIHALGEHGKPRHIRALEEYAAREHARDPENRTWPAEQVRKATDGIKQRSGSPQEITLAEPVGQQARQAEPTEQPEAVSAPPVPQTTKTPIEVATVEVPEPEEQKRGFMLPLFIGLVAVLACAGAWLLRRRA